MNLKHAVGWFCFGLLSVVVTAPAGAQTRGKAELKGPSGSITIDYGRPSLKGRDMLSQLQEGAFWRMGMNPATVLRTPVDLTFGKTVVAKGAYSLFLKKTGDTFHLVFNSQTGQWGTEHDPAKDVPSVPMTKAALAAPVETFTMGLPATANGGAVELTWGDEAHLVLRDRDVGGQGATLLRRGPSLGGVRRSSRTWAGGTQTSGTRLAASSLAKISVSRMSVFTRTLAICFP